MFVILSNLLPNKAIFIHFDNGNGAQWRGFIPIPPQIFVPGGNAYNVTAEQQGSLYRLNMQVFVQGYAYSKTNGTAWFSIIILLVVYAPVASVFIIVSVLFDAASTLWESMIEPLVLAIQSQKI